MDNQTMEIMALSETAETPMSASVGSGLLDSLKERFSGQEPWAIELIVFSLGGFVAGFLLKNFGKLALLIIAAALITVLVLHYTHINEMPFEKLQELLGINDAQTVQDIVNAKITFCKKNPVALFSGLVGLFVGWKVG